MIAATLRRVLTGRVLAGAFVLAWFLAAALPAQATTVRSASAAGAVVGAAVSSRGGGSAQAAIADLEARLGYKLGGHRIYSPDFTLPTALLDDDASHGRISYLSVKPPGGSTDWRSFADTGRPQMDALAQQLGALTNDGSHRIAIALQHEPDVGAKASISRADFRDMQTQFLSAVRSQAQKVTRQIIFGGYKLFTGELSQDQMAEYLPVDRTLVDTIGADPFGNDQTTLAQLAGPMVSFAAAEGKPVALEEVGVRYLNCDRTVWVTDALAWIRSQPRINAVLWFQSNVGADPLQGFDPQRDFWLEGDGATYANNVETFDRWKSITAGDSYWMKAPK